MTGTDIDDVRRTAVESASLRMTAGAGPVGRPGAG